MDALDRLTGPARDLLSRVDAILAREGAPDDHPIWPLLRQLGALPGEVVGGVAALRPAPLAAAGPVLRALSGQYAQPPVTAPDWQGPAAEAFAARWADLSAHVEDGLAGRLADTASFTEAVAAWASTARRDLARTLATVMTSAEAVTMVTGRTIGTWDGVESTNVARAAADIAARVLGTVADVYAEADALLATWSGRLGELPFTPPPALPGAPPGAGSINIPR